MSLATRGRYEGIVILRIKRLKTTGLSELSQAPVRTKGTISWLTLLQIKTTKILNKWTMAIYLIRAYFRRWLITTLSRRRIMIYKHQQTNFRNMVSSTPKLPRRIRNLRKRLKDPKSEIRWPRSTLIPLTTQAKSIHLKSSVRLFLNRVFLILWVPRKLIGSSWHRFLRSK